MNSEIQNSAFENRVVVGVFVCNELRCFGLPTIATLFYLELVLYNVLLQYFRFYNEAFYSRYATFYSPHRDYPYAYHSQSLLLLMCKRK